MKSSYLAQAVYAALLFGLATAHAQTTTPASASPVKTMPVSSTPNTTGNDLLNGAKVPIEDRLATPATTGENKASGNDLVTGNRNNRETGTHPAWSTLDTHKNGYLTANDLKSHKWLRQSFSRCDADHDGHLTQKEYENCIK